MSYNNLAVSCRKKKKSDCKKLSDIFLPRTWPWHNYTFLELLPKDFQMAENMKERVGKQSLDFRLVCILTNFESY